MSDWLKQTLLALGAALLGWLLLQQLETATIVSRLEAHVGALDKRMELFVDKVLPMLEKCR